MKGKFIFCEKCGKRKPKKGSRYNWAATRFVLKGQRDGHICRDCQGVK